MLFDRFDNHSASATTPVSLSFASNPTSATLLGTTTVAATGGGVSFPGVAVDRPGTPFALYAGAGGLFGDTSVGFEILPALAAAYSVQGPETAVVGTPGSYTVTAVDALATAVPYYTGTATVTTSDTAAELPGTVAFTEGVATISVTFQTAGAQTLTFTESAGSTTGSISVGVDAPPPPDSDDGCGCGTGNAGSSAALLALLILARPRRRTPSPA
jgi:MYXO-CTERM domain-containing protein